MVEVLRVGYCLPFLSPPPLSSAPLPMPSYSPTSIKGAALEEVTLGLVIKGAVELAPLPSPGFYSHLFVVLEDLGVVASSHRPLPSQSLCVTCLHFRWRPFSLYSCRCIRGTGWPPSISRKRIFRCRFILLLVTFFASSSEQGLSVQGSLLWLLHGYAGLHQGHGSCFCHPPFYGDPYEALPRRLARPVLLSRSLLRDLQTVLRLCHELGIVVNPQKSNLVPSQVVQYLGVIIDTTSFRASPSQERISKLQSTAEEFRSSPSPPASLWLSLLGVLSSLAHLVLAAAADEVSPALPPPILGSSRSRGASVCVGGMSLRPPMVAPPSSPVFRSVSLPGVSRPTLLVRRLRRGVGCPSRLSGRFRPLGLASGGVVHQRQGAAGRKTGSSPVPVILYEVARWLSFATTPQRWRISARRGALGLLSSTPCLRRSCAGQSPSPST